MQTSESPLTRTPLAKVENQMPLPTSALKMNGDANSPSAPPEGAPAPAPGVRTASSTHSRLPAAQARRPRAARQSSPARSPPPRARGPPVRRPELRAPGSANRLPRHGKAAAGDVAASPPLLPPRPSPAASAVQSRAPAYPQLFEIRHFIPPAGAAAAATTAPPPAAANDAAATTAAAASSTILHWAPLKTPRFTGRDE